MENKKKLISENYVRYLLFVGLLAVAYFKGYHFYELWQEIVYFLILSLITWLFINGFKVKFEKKCFVAMVLALIVFLITPIYGVGGFNLYNTGNQSPKQWYRKNLTWQESIIEIDISNNVENKIIEITSRSSPMHINDFDLNDLNQNIIIENIVISYSNKEGNTYFKFKLGNLNYYGWFVTTDYEISEIKECIIRLNKNL